VLGSDLTEDINVNSEELEQSLRAEFESYLKDVFSEVKREISGFQEKIDSEFKEQRARIDQALEELAAKVDFDRVLEESFRDTVTEHLRLARDEGARITATAIAEAEELHGSGITAEDVQGEFENLRDAIAEIGSKSSQAEILKSLVHHATEHTPRGAFFIVKNEHLVGWRVFGRENHEELDAVRELFFPLEEQTVLSEAVTSLATVKGFGEGYRDEEMYLTRLGFSQPRKMYAIPLVARGRGVAVLYADCGDDGGSINAEALESLVCVAGLTVELLASGQVPTAGAVHTHHEAADEPAAHQWDGVEEHREETFEPRRHQDTAPSEESSHQSADSQQDAAEDGPATWSEVARETGFSTVDEEPEDRQVDEEGSASGFSFTSSEPVQTEVAEVVSEQGFEHDEVGSFDDADDFAETFEPADGELSDEEVFESEVEKLYDASDAVELVDEDAGETFEAVETAEVSEEESWGREERSDEPMASPSFGSFESPAQAADPAETDEAEPAVEKGFEYGSLQEEADRAAREFEAQEMSEADEAEAEEVEESQPEPEPVAAVTEPAAVAEGSMERRRLADRNIDLPIEVPEDERKYHNAARRFARLLVSEIRLYNEQKVSEGCEANDLYDRLKEAIDRSRDMYEKRVQEPVAKTFDYFDFELVNNLAGGDESKLGDSYPGAKV